MHHRPFRTQATLYSLPDCRVPRSSRPSADGPSGMCCEMSLCSNVIKGDSCPEKYKHIFIQESFVEYFIYFTTFDLRVTFLSDLKSFQIPICQVTSLTL